jgi:dihydroflavonol-4-reductase
MNLVTGTTGQIGNVLVRELLGSAQRVQVFVRPGKTPLALAGPDVEIIPGDVLDADSLERAMHGVSLVYHLAGRISLAAGLDPETERVNLEGTQNIIAAMDRSGIPRLVYASSVYAFRKPANGTLIDESQPFDVIQCQGAYDCSKARARWRSKAPWRMGWMQLSFARRRSSVRMISTILRPGAPSACICTRA